MVDDLKKKKADGKRIALGQKHERVYLKKIAKKLVEFCDVDMKEDPNKIRSRIPFCGNKVSNFMAASSIKRIAKALLKCLEKY